MNGLTKVREIRFGLIGCGLMGREFASAAARWMHLLDVNFHPRVVAVCDTNPAALEWFVQHVPDVKTFMDYRAMLDWSDIDAVYCAVPHHLHEQLYTDIIRAGKHLVGEKPFGIDEKANRAILKATTEHPDLVVRCSSEFPFYPGPYRIARWMQEGRFGRIIDVEAGFWHSSDLNPAKPVNWKRQVKTNGAYGCMGDLGLHVVHLPIRFGWRPNRMRALLSNIFTQRPDGRGGTADCDTWDNAVLACDVHTPDQDFPMTLSMKRIAPGHNNTWFLRIHGTELSVEYSTRNPKQFAFMPYTPGGSQSWHIEDLPYESAYRTITGNIFEFGFSDSLLQMWAAFCDEIVNGKQMLQPFVCTTPEETVISHQWFNAALTSWETGQTVSL